MPEAYNPPTPAELVCIARAAHLCGDKNLLRKTRNRLREVFGIEIRFTDSQTKERKRREAVK